VTKKRSEMKTKHRRRLEVWFENLPLSVKPLERRPYSPLAVVWTTDQPSSDFSLQSVHTDQCGAELALCSGGTSVFFCGRKATGA
jgi:hypothetical protein